MDAAPTAMIAIRRRVAVAAPLRARRADPPGTAGRGPRTRTGARPAGLAVPASRSFHDLTGAVPASPCIRAKPPRRSGPLTPMWAHRWPPEGTWRPEGDRTTVQWRPGDPVAARRRGGRKKGPGV